MLIAILGSNDGKHPPLWTHVRQRRIALPWARRLTVAGSALLLASPLNAAATPRDVDNAIAALSREVVAEIVATDPASAYLAGVNVPVADRWPDRSSAGIAASHRREEALLQRARHLLGQDASTEARRELDLMVERLEASIQLRSCRHELWNVNHMFGWPTMVSHLAARQPIATPADRSAALRLWRRFPAFVDQEIANLERGLMGGWSSPKSVVRRAVPQVRKLAAEWTRTGAFQRPAAASDPQWRDAIAGMVVPALEFYADYIETFYLPRARDSVAVSANPDGPACYRASIRRWTGLDRDPQSVFRKGRQTVDANLAAIAALNGQTPGSLDLAAIRAAMASESANRFENEAGLLDFLKATTARARNSMDQVVPKTPDQALAVEPLRSFMRGSGATSHYEPEPDSARPAFFRVSSESWRSETRSGAEITAFHEGWPGHHLQAALAMTRRTTDLERLTQNSAVVEGWGRYAEQLAEELGLYGSEQAAIQRRLWPARAMVADPGLHLFGWSREQAVDWLDQAGRFSRDDIEGLIDRSAVMPGQLTAYDLGALEIVALRSEAQTALGNRFDLRAFHEIILQEGAVTLPRLRRSVERWVAARKGAPTSELSPRRAIAGTAEDTAATRP